MSDLDNGLTLGGTDNMQAPEGKRIDQESGFVVGSSEHRNYYREKKEREQRDREQEINRRAADVEQRERQLQEALAAQHRPRATFDDSVHIEEDFDALAPTLRNTAEFAQSYADEQIGSVKATFEARLEALNEQQTLYQANAMFEDKALLNSPEFQSYLDNGVFGGLATFRETIAFNAKKGDLEKTLLSLKQAASLYRTEGGAIASQPSHQSYGDTMPNMQQMAGPTYESNTVQNHNTANTQLLDESWEAKIEEAKQSFRQNNSLNQSQKQQLELKYEAVQSYLRRLSTVKDPQERLSLQKVVTQMALDYGVVRP